MKFHQTTRFSKTIQKINLASKKARVLYALEGGNAIDIYANPPVTRDIDILVYSHKPRSILQFLRNLVSLNMTIGEHYDELENGYLISFLKDKDTKIEVDIKYSKWDESLIKAVKKAKWIKLNQVRVRVVSLELLLVLKLLAYRDRKLGKDYNGAKSLIQNCLGRMNKKILYAQLQKERLIPLFWSFCKFERR